MMSRTTAECLVTGAIGIGFWLFVCSFSGTREPWDAEGYWNAAYPGSVLLAGLIGFRADRRGWLVGLVLTLAQFPVMLMLSGIGTMSLFALLLLGALAIPVMLASALTSRVGRRSRRS